MTVLLEADDGTTLELDDCDAGYLVESVEIGAPEVRAAVTPRAQADGVIDRTRFVGARAITVNLRLVAEPSSRSDLMAALTPFLHPGVRVDLTIVTDPGYPRLWRVRPDDWSAPWARPTDLEISLSWVTTTTSPYGLSTDLHSITLVPSMGEEIGRSYNETASGREYDRTYPSGQATVAPVINAGSVPAQWTAIVHGPITAFTLRNVTTDQQLSFPTLVIPAGQTVVIDSNSRTVLANGEPGSSRYSYIDFATSEWFELVPGLNQLAVISTTYSAPAQTVIEWRDAYLI